MEHFGCQNPLTVVLGGEINYCDKRLQNWNKKCGVWKVSPSLMPSQALATEERLIVL
jgi:hypothetical protein